MHDYSSYQLLRLATGSLHADCSQTTKIMGTRAEYGKEGEEGRTWPACDRYIRRCRVCPLSGRLAGVRRRSGLPPRRTRRAWIRCSPGATHPAPGARGPGLPTSRAPDSSCSSQRLASVTEGYREPRPLRARRGPASKLLRWTHDSHTPKTQNPHSGAI